MSNKRSLVVFIGIITLVFPVTVFSQLSVRGTVTDRENIPLTGVAVQLKGTTVGTVTDVDGIFEIRVVTPSDTLIFSYVGYQPLHRSAGKVNGSNVVLNDVIELEEVIVTALGIEREQKSIPYAFQQVESRDLVIARQTSVNNALAGKVAGLQVFSTSAMRLDNENQAWLRGVASLEGPQTPLYVVDGTPSDNLPSMDDIESITVLKGPNAAALYGQRGNAGAIIVTTKRASQSRGIGIEINQSTYWDKVYVLPRYQNRYAGGSFPEMRTFQWQDGMPEEWQVFEGKQYHDYSDDVSWGPRMEGQEYIPWYAWYTGSDVFGETATLDPQPHNVRDFYDTGLTTFNNINFQTANDQQNLRVSFTYQNIQGVIPKTRQDKYSLATRAYTQLGKHFRLGLDLNFITNETSGNFDEGWGNNFANGSHGAYFHRHLDMNKMRELRDLRSPEGILASWNHLNPEVYLQSPRAFYSGFWNYNFYSFLDNQSIEYNRRSLTGNINLTYRLSDKFQITGFVRRDQETSVWEEKTYNILEQSALQTGLFNAYSTGTDLDVEENYELLATYRDQYGKYLGIEINLGANIRKDREKRISGFTQQGLNIPDLFTLANSKVRTTPSENRERREVRSLYARGSFGFRDLLYFDWSVRGDWTSTLPADNNGYVYPSLGGSFVFSELLNKNQTILSFGKVRGSWAQVGSSLGPYQLDLNYSVSPRQWNGNFLSTTPNTLTDPSIRPALSSAFELGLDFRFFLDRMGVSFTYYREKKIDEILGIPVTQATGFSQFLINAGRIDREGWELQFQAAPLRSSSWNWDLMVNLSAVRNEVKELAEGVETQLFFGNQSLSLLNAVGEQAGQIYGGAILRNEEGLPVLNPEGFYIQEPNVLLDNIAPDLFGGLVNTLSFRNWSLRFSIDFSVGGAFFSGTHDTGNFNGLLEATAATNDRGKNVRDPVADGGGVRVDGVDQEGNPLTVYIPARDYYQQFFGTGISEPFIYDRTFVKMRELSLSYQLPVQRWGIGSVIQAASIAFVAQNPWLIYSANPDLDVSEATTGTFEFGQMPSVRSFGFNLKCSF